MTWTLSTHLAHSPKGLGVTASGEGLRLTETGPQQGTLTLPLLWLAGWEPGNGYLPQVVI